MKQRNTGLHVGKYREKPNFKTNLAATILPAVLIFCALAGLFLTATGSTSLLPLFASAGLIFLLLFTLAKHFRKEAILLPAALVLLIIIVCFARSLLLNGFAALWNETRDLWASEKGILLALAETDGSGLWLASILLGLFLAALSLALSRVPTLASVFLILLTVAAGLVHVTPWLLVSSGIALLLLAWQKNTVSAVNFLLLGAVVLGIAALVLQTGTMQSLSQTAKDALHHWRYEKIRTEFCRKAIRPSLSLQQTEQKPFCPLLRTSPTRSICAASSAIPTKTEHGRHWMPKPPQRKKICSTGSTRTASTRSPNLHFLPHKPQNTKPKPSKFQIFLPVRFTAMSRSPFYQPMPEQAKTFSFLPL